MLKTILKTGLALGLASTLLNAADITKGKILQIKDGGGYSYLKLQTKDSKEQWAAVPGGLFKVGQTIEISEQMRTPSFNSKTLNETFTNIIFGTIKDDAAPKTRSVSKEDYLKAHSKKKVVYNKDGVKTTITDVLENFMSYDKKIIEIEGEIIKVSRNIMNTNWVHIKDKNGKKLIFRTNEDRVLEGLQVMAKGAVLTNVDYGYGYKYEVIVVDAVFKAAN